MSNQTESSSSTSKQNVQGGQSQKQSGKSGRGFASMDPERQREIASQGGRAAHAAGTAHEFTSEEARAAGSRSHSNRSASRSAAASSKNAESSGSRDVGKQEQSPHQNEGSQNDQQQHNRSGSLH